MIETFTEQEEAEPSLCGDISTEHKEKQLSLLVEKPRALAEGPTTLPLGRLCWQGWSRGGGTHR